MIRTLQPWGHRSRADLAFRQRLSGALVARARVERDKNAAPLFRRLRELLVKLHLHHATDEERVEVQTLADALNVLGYSDRDIERAL